MVSTVFRLCLLGGKLLHLEVEAPSVAILRLGCLGVLC